MSLGHLWESQKLVSLTGHMLEVDKTNQIESV